MSFRGFDIGSGINHYADLMAQGQKDQIELQKAYVAQQQAQAEKQFHDAILAQSNAYRYGKPGEEGLSQADLQKNSRTELMAGASKENTTTRTATQKKIADENNALEEKKQLALGRDPEYLFHQSQIKNYNDDINRYSKIVNDPYVDRRTKPATKAQLDQAIAGKAAAMAAAESRMGKIVPGMSKTAPMYGAPATQMPQSPQVLNPTAPPVGQVLVKFPGEAIGHYVPQDKVQSAVKDYNAVVVGQ